MTNADWSSFTRQGETVTAGPLWTPAGIEIVQDPAWAARVAAALNQQQAGQVRPIDDVFNDVDADD